MLSMPPATTILAEPARIASWPSMAAFMPEPQTLLTVVQTVDFGQIGAECGLTRGGLFQPGGKDAAHEDFVGRFVLEARTFERAADGGGAELGRGRGFELALKAAERRARGAHDDDGFGG